LLRRLFVAEATNPREERVSLADERTEVPIVPQTKVAIRLLGNGAIADF
jgi:hypothetical protein